MRLKQPSVGELLDRTPVGLLNSLAPSLTDISMPTRRHLLLTAGLFATLPALPARAQAQSPRDTALALVHDTAGAPALGGMVVGPEGPLWVGALGARRAGSSDEVSAQDRWHLGSNTKAMTAALYGRLVDQGLVAWGATLSALLPEMEMAPAWRETRIEAVMSHTAGLLDDIALGPQWLTTSRADPRPLVDQRRDLANAMLQVPPSGEAGAFAYANSNYILLGAVIERVTGKAWEDVMEEQLFLPLGITSGGFGAPAGANPWGHREGLPVDPETPGSDNPKALGPAGTVHMTLADYSLFLRVFLNDGAGWLSPESLAVLSRALGQGTPAYGGGWLIADGQPWAGGPALTHDGSNTMWYVSTWVAPGVGRAFVAVANTAGAGRSACQQLIPGLIRAG